MDQTQVWDDRNGESSGFDDFAFKFSNWLSGLPGDAERFLEESANMGQLIMWATVAAREKIVARGVPTALGALVGRLSLDNQGRYALVKALPLEPEEISVHPPHHRSAILGHQPNLVDVPSAEPVAPT